MLSRLHLHPLLRRFSSLTQTAFSNTAGNHGTSISTARTTRTLFNRRHGLPPPVHCAKNHPKQLCTRANETEEEASTDPIFAPYLSARIRCRRADAVMLSESLLCFGASSASMDEESTCEDLDEICITSIFADGEDVHSCIVHAKNAIELNYVPAYEVLKGEQSDWVADVQESFQPIEVTDGLWIVPKWRTPPELEAINIILDPGLAFGTGEHPTTKLCLLLLHGLVKGGEHFLDYGTGSGVLGIAAVKMGAVLSVGIDIDPLAVRSARQNIALNQIDGNRMSVHLISRNGSSFASDESHEGHLDTELDSMKEKFDIVISNILLNPLIQLAEGITAYAKPGAAVGVSGILSEQVQQAKEHYSKYLMNISVSEMDGWACLFGRRR